MMSKMLKKGWREILILVLGLICVLQYNQGPEIREVTKVEYVDKIVEKIVTVEKETLSNKKRRTTVTKPDGTKIVTEEETDKKTTQDKVENAKENETTESSEQIVEINKHRYTLGVQVKLYPEIEYAASLQMRLGDLPITIGPVIYVREANNFQFSYGLGIQIEI